MSLINDALRRANQAKKNRSAESNEHVLQPVEPRRSKSNFVPPILFALAILMLMVAGWFFWRALQEKKSVKTIAAQPVAAKPAISVPEPETQPAIPAPVKPEPVVVVAQTVPAPEANSATTNVAENPVGDVSNTNAIAETNAVPPPPGPPSFKLQGILFRVANPTALINGKALQTGDSISGARVTKITKSDVTLEWKDKVIVLELP